MALAASPCLPGLSGNRFLAAGNVLGVAPVCAVLWFVIYTSGQALKHHPRNLVPISSASVTV